MSQTISFLFHALFFFTPLLLWPKMSEVFEFPKMLFVYTMTILITTTWIFSWIKTKKITIARTPLDTPILIFLLIQILATIFSIDPHTSLWGYYSRFHGGLASTISYILLFYAFTSGVQPQLGLNPKNPKNNVLPFINTLLLSTTLISIYAILEHFGIDKHVWVQDVQSRVFSTLGQPNWLSAYLVAILPLYLLSTSKTYNFLSILVITAIIFTKSQSGIAAMAIVLFVILFINLQKRHSGLSRILLLLVPVIVLIRPIKPLSSINLINPFYSTTQEIVQNDLKTRGNTGSDSMAIRRVVWQGAIDLGKKYPILGTGPETFAYSYYWTRPAEHNLLSEWDFLYNKAHNEYLNFFATTGFLGLGSYLLLIIWTTIWWLKSTKTTPGVVPLFIGWLSILITNLFGFSVVAVALLFFLFPALAISLTNTKTKTTSIKLPQLLTLVLLLPISVYLLISITNTFKADILYNQSKSQPSLELLESAVKLQPNQPLFLAQLAEQESKTAAAIFLQLKQSPQPYQDLALKHAQQATNMNKYNINLLKSKARVEIYLSNIDPTYQQQALNTLLQASLLAPTDAKLLFNVGILYQNLQKPDLAANSFKKAVELKPNYAEALYNLNKL
ncbi:O-antigen ligase family protein [Patescibacteria group bacterium]|nr:O-antigen ligase family protein [Patescibacteria group bacterium]